MLQTVEAQIHIDENHEVETIYMAMKWSNLFQLQWRAEVKRKSVVKSQYIYHL